MQIYNNFWKYQKNVSKNFLEGLNLKNTTSFKKEKKRKKNQKRKKNKKYNIYNI